LKIVTPRPRVKIAGLHSRMKKVLVFILGCAAASAAEETVQLPRFEVRERGISDFGMSIVTNPEVANGGKISWMIVGYIVPGSAAAQAGLKPGEKIIAIDGADLSALSKDAMLRTFFQREIGDRVRLSLGGAPRKPGRSVELVCNAKQMESKPRAPGTKTR
jgi:hypothetical protein